MQSLAAAAAGVKPETWLGRVAGERWPELRRDLVALLDDWNQAGDGVRIEQEYLITVGRKR